MHSIYCDHNSTTMIDERVVEAMVEAYKNASANPSSGHRWGRKTRVVLDEAREQIATLMGVKATEIVFTGSGSESDNLAILGSLYSPDARGRHCITAATEHHAVLAASDWVRARGFEVTVLPVDNLGRIDPDDFRKAIRPDTQLATIMLANNEVGTIHPIAELARIAHEHGVWFHTDAVQAMGKIPVSIADLDCDLLSLASHKFYGPKGFGILYVRSGLKLAPVIAGGGQELGRRAGTEDIAGAVGTAKAMQLLADDPDEMARVAKIASEFRTRLTEAVDDMQVFGDPDNQLPNTVGAGFAGIDGHSLMMALDLRGIAVSTGSACATGATKPSHVLTAMGVDDKYTSGTIRFSFGRYSKPDDARIIADAVAEDVKKLRAGVPVSS
ncbi:MAG: cysteine desulfurase NifS [Candidatus Zixiibacteriota bacterium]